MLGNRDELENFIFFTGCAVQKQFWFHGSVHYFVDATVEIV
jgi:hypothetical protein